MRKGLRPQLIGLCGLLLLSSCVTKPVEIAKTEQFKPSCGYAHLYLYFIEETDSLHTTHKALARYSDVMPTCQSIEVQVYGLPQTSDQSLQGRRAATVARVLNALGWPVPSFDLGEPEDVKKPVIVIKPTS